MSLGSDKIQYKQKGFSQIIGFFVASKIETCTSSVPPSGTSGCCISVCWDTGGEGRVWQLEAKREGGDNSKSKTWI